MKLHPGLAATLCFLASVDRLYAESLPAPVAHLVTYSGSVQVVRDGLPLAIYPGFPLLDDDLVVTQEGRALVRFSDSTQLRVGPRSKVSASEPHPKRTIRLITGRLWAFMAKLQRTSTFETGSTVAAVRGTELSISYDGDRTELAVFEGDVAVENPLGSVTISPGQTAVAEPGRAPVLRAVARPRDAVQWALYYPPVLELRPEELEAGHGTAARLRESVERFRSRDLKGAAEALEDVDGEEVRDPRFFTHRASLRLALGEVEEARADIRSALRLASRDPDALSLEAIMAVVGDEKDKALELARQAVASDAQSATARIALSYAQQAGFDLRGARDSLETAVKLKPKNALAWARLSEIRSSQGDLDGALDAAEQAMAIEPNLARTQTVLGFAYLTQVRTEPAMVALKKAIALDPSDPLPRLGLGLALIREGQLGAGRAEIETAVSLDPNNALLRSYLGKAYFEEKRPQLDEREYAKARELDPLDPTPWFYHAIAKQVLNQPVEALHDLQGAIERNDNRVVYRSRLLLDSDLAARSASLGRIYTDLGFQRLALVEGWRSVNTDPGDYSAHRLLADSYSALPRHEIARVSELLQSQLLQPINTTPIQPRLAESNLFLLSSQGPKNLAFNEFNPLFNRDQITVQGSAFVGEDATWVVDPLVSGIYKKASFSAGYSRFETDGFRVNNHQHDEVANAFGQLELNHKTSVQLEVRYRKLEQGDPTLSFYADDFSPFRRDESETNTQRVGLRHGFGPGSTALVSYIHQNRDGTGHDAFPPIGSLDIDRNERAHSGEAQYLFRSSDLDWLDGLLLSVNFTAGVGYFHIDSDETAVVQLSPPPDLPPPPIGPGPIVQELSLDKQIRHTNLYLYSYLAMPRHVTVTLGLSGERFDERGGTGERNQVNPKFGITWNPWPRTTLRAAALKAMKRTLVTDQTLEPTQVAGFNQFFDDPSGTDVTIYGGAVDQKLTADLFAGAEYSKRSLDFPVVTFSDTGEILFTEETSTEHVTRAYLFATPEPWLSLSAEYQYEKRRKDPITNRFEELHTHLAPLGVQVFDRRGLSGSFRVTYLNQNGDFLRQGQSLALAGERDFWVADAALRYRLPKRYGYVSLGVNNLSDERSTYQPTDPNNPTIRPGRLFFGSVTLALP